MVEYYWFRVTGSLFILELFAVAVWFSVHPHYCKDIVPEWMKAIWWLLNTVVGVLACGFGRHRLVDTGLVIHGAVLSQCTRCGLQIKGRPPWPPPPPKHNNFVMEKQEETAVSESRTEQIPNFEVTATVTQTPEWAASNNDLAWLNTLARATEEDTQKQTDPIPQQAAKPGIRVIRFESKLKRAE